MTPTTDLHTLITTTLGVTPPAPPAVTIVKSNTVPPRPLALWEYNVTFYKSCTGSITVQANSEDDARDHAGDVAWDDIDWSDDDDVDISDVYLETKHIINQDALDEWDAEYGKLYDEDGDPKCSNCENNEHEDNLHLNDAEDEWLCASCLNAFES